MEKKSTCNTYISIPVVVKSAQGCFLEDIEGFKYIDTLCGYATVNFGHNEKSIINEMIK